MGKIDFVRNLLRTSRQPAWPKAATVPRSFLDARTAQPEYAKVGLDLLRGGKVAVLMVAGGLSTRLGGDVHRGNLAVGPVTRRSLFRLQAEKLAALKRRYAPAMPWLIMTSAAVHEEIVRSFRREDYFGLPADEIAFFMQDSLPVLDAHQEPVLLSDGACLEAPTGHGGMLEALARSPLIARLREAKIDYLFSFQYPNVLERLCDPVMLGYHHRGGFEVTTKAVLECQVGEKMGRYVEAEGRLQLVEYHFFEQAPAGLDWQRLPASVGTHVWSMSFLQDCIERGLRLPFHVLPHLAAGAPPGLQKVEQFIFDLLLCANRAGLVVVARDEEYAMVKSLNGPDSLESARVALSRLYRRWLEQAGAISQTPEGLDCRLEISPLFALGPADLKEKLPAGFRFADGLVLE